MYQAVQPCTWAAEYFLTGTYPPPVTDLAVVGLIVDVDSCDLKLRALPQNSAKILYLVDFGACAGWRPNPSVNSKSMTASISLAILLLRLVHFNRRSFWQRAMIRQREETTEAETTRGSQTQRMFVD